MVGRALGAEHGVVDLRELGQMPGGERLGVESAAGPLAAGRPAAGLPVGRLPRRRPAVASPATRRTTRADRSGTRSAKRG